MDDYDFSGSFGASPDGLGATVRVLGDSEQQQAVTSHPLARPLKVAWALASVAGAAAGAYHGYRRNDSVGWALVWALAGSAFPVITVPIAIAQGFGEEAP